MTPTGSLNIKTYVGTKEVLTSGLVHVQGKEEIVISIDLIKIALQFKVDEGVSRYAGRTVPNDPNKLMLDLFNHNNPLGEGVYEPFEIATIEGRKLLMTYLATKPRLELDVYSLTYVLYLGDKK